MTHIRAICNNVILIQGVHFHFYRGAGTLQWLHPSLCFSSRSFCCIHCKLICTLALWCFLSAILGSRGHHHYTYGQSFVLNMGSMSQPLFYERRSHGNNGTLRKKKKAHHIDCSSIRIPDCASILPLHTLLWSHLSSIFSPHQFKLHVLLVFPTHYVDIVPTGFCGTITCIDRLFHTTTGHCDLALLPVLDSLMRSLVLGWTRQLMFSIFIVLSGVRCAHAKPWGHNSNAFWAILHTHIALHTGFVAPYDPTEATSSSAHKCFLSTSDGLPGGSFIHALTQYERIYGAMFPFWKARPTKALLFVSTFGHCSDDSCCGDLSTRIPLFAAHTSSALRTQ